MLDNLFPIIIIILKSTVPCVVLFSPFLKVSVFHLFFSLTFGLATNEFKKKKRILMGKTGTEKPLKAPKFRLSTPHTLTKLVTTYKISIS